MRNNRKWIAAVVAVVVVAAIVAIIGGACSGHARGSVARPPSTAKRPAHRPHPLRPVYNPPSQGNSDTSASQQQADNARIAAQAPAVGEWAAVEALSLPAPAPSAQFPAIPHANRQNPDSYAAAFVTELLSIDFAADSRPSLLSWAVSETSPETTPGTPASAASKFLYFNLVAPGSPAPPAASWSADASAGVTWSVSKVTMSVAPAWSQALAAGWQPPDLRMTFLDVTGNLTVTQTGQPPVVKPFSLQLGLGTAEYHNGYGAMSLNNWTVG